MYRGHQYDLIEHKAITAGFIIWVAADWVTRLTATKQKKMPLTDTFIQLSNNYKETFHFLSVNKL